jgi:hypothetical protein
MAFGSDNFGDIVFGVFNSGLRATVTKTIGISWNTKKATVYNRTISYSVVNGLTQQLDISYQGRTALSKGITVSYGGMDSVSKGAIISWQINPEDIPADSGNKFYLPPTNRVKPFCI